jgi:xylulokinase
VRVSGGGARSLLWRQILADVFNAELVTVNTTEGAAYGAALLAGVGCGIFSDTDAACAEAVKITGSTAPQDINVKKYDRLYAIYQELYPTLKDISHRLGQV